MKTFNFTVDFCGTLGGSIEAESAEDAREKLAENLRINPSLECDKDAEIYIEWDCKSKCHGNCCAFTGATDDEYGVDITEDEDA